MLVPSTLYSSANLHSNSSSRGSMHSKLPVMAVHVWPHGIGSSHPDSGPQLSILMMHGRQVWVEVSDAVVADVVDTVEEEVSVDVCLL